MNEQDLVEGLRERREAAVASFLERYRSLFYHCIGHFETDQSARDDLYQDLVIYVLDRIDRDRFDGTKGSLGTWLYRVAWCRCVDLKRKAGGRRQVRLSTVGEQVPDQEDERPGPVDQVVDSEMGVVVRNALTTLEKEERSLLDLRFVQGQTLGQIARELCISLEQTKYRLKRAQVSLRKVLLNQYAVEESYE